MYPLAGLAGQGFRRAGVNDAVPAFAPRPHLAVSQGGLPRPPFSGLPQPFASRALTRPRSAHVGAAAALDAAAA